MSQQLEPIFLTYATPHKRKGHNFNGHRCLHHSHRGQSPVYHYACVDCGADCTAGQPAGPATSVDEENFTRCRVCFETYQRATQAHTTTAVQLLDTVTRFFTRAAAVALLIAVSLAAHAQTFTRSSSIEMGVAAGSITADALTTRGMLSRGWEEKNPLARPFTTSPGGTAAYFGGSFALLILANNRLRNHPRWRHALNWSVIGTESFWSAHNSRLGTPSCVKTWITQGVIVPPCHR